MDNGQWRRDVGVVVGRMEGNGRARRKRGKRSGRVTGSLRLCWLVPRIGVAKVENSKTPNKKGWLPNEACVAGTKSQAKKKIRAERKEREEKEQERRRKVARG